MTSVPLEIFRAYDIRGRAVGGDAPLTPELAKQIGLAYADYLPPAARAVVGGDQRATTPALMEAVTEGLLAGGIDVVELGRAPSPLVYWASARLHPERSTGGVVVTASHNPLSDNGLKLLEPGGLPLLPDAIQSIARRVVHGLHPRPGRGHRSTWDAKLDYLASLSERFALARPMLVAIDPGNGIASATAERALRVIGADVTALNDDPDEPHPPHPADPQHAANVEQLAVFVQDSGAELGFAFDGDGDRLGLVDGLGRRAAPDLVLALLAQDWLASHPSASIQVDVKTSRAVIEHIDALGGRAVFGPVGHSLAKHAMLQRGIDFGGEASTHYYYRLNEFERPAQITDDAVRTACRITQLAARTPLTPLLDAIPRYPISPEVKIACADAVKHITAAAVAQAARQRWPTNELDGARIDLSAETPGAWCLVRASNTTPYLTVVVEASNLDGYERAQRLAAALLAEHGLDPSPLLSQPPLL